MRNVAIIVFSIFWMVVVLADYWNKHILHHEALEYFSYPWLVVGLVTISAITTGIVKYSDKVSQLKLLAKPILFLFPFLAFCLLLLGNSQNFANMDLSIGTHFSFLGKILINLGILALIWLSAVCLGNAITSRFGINIDSKPSVTLDLGIGLMAYCTVLFIFGFVHVLYLPTIAIMLIGSIAVNYRYALDSLRWFTLKNIEPKKLNWLGYTFLSIIIFVLALNFVTNLAPFPSGFDSRNYYMNVTNLIADNHGLIRGFQPYPWQLFMSQGQLLTGTDTVALLLSYSSFVFVLIGMYEICVHYLRIRKEFAFLVMAIISLTPAFQNHMFVELKVDFGLLIIQMAMIILMLKGLTYVKINNAIPKNSYFIALGLLTGFGASIKMLNFYLIFAVVVAIWSLIFNYRGFFSTFLISLSLVLITKFDAVTGMDVYHLSIDIVKYAAMVGGLTFFVTLALGDMQKFLDTLSKTTLYSAIVITSLSPWFIKNYTETKTLDPNALIRGAEPGPRIGMEKIIENYNKQK